MNLFKKKFYEKLKQNCTEDFIFDKKQEQYDNYIEEKKEELLKVFYILREQTDRYYRNLKRSYKESAYNKYNYEENTLLDYPKGFCGQITNTIYKNFQKHPLYLELSKKGIIIKKIFGIRNRNTFQNSIQIGNYYINVAGYSENSKKKPQIEFELYNEDLFKNIENYKEYLQIINIYWNYKIKINPIAKLSFIMPFLITNENQAYFYKNIPKKLILKTFLEDFKEIEEILILNQNYISLELNESQKRVLQTQLINFNFIDFNILNNINHIQKWQELKKEREIIGKEKFDEKLYNKIFSKEKL